MKGQRRPQVDVEKAWEITFSDMGKGGKGQEEDHLGPTKKSRLASAWSPENLGLVVGMFFNRFTTKFFFTPIKYYILKELGMTAQDVVVEVQMAVSG